MRVEVLGNFAAEVVEAEPDERGPVSLLVAVAEEVVDLFHWRRHLRDIVVLLIRYGSICVYRLCIAFGFACVVPFHIHIDIRAQPILARPLESFDTTDPARLSSSFHPFQRYLGKGMKSTKSTEIYESHDILQMMMP